ncbi:BglG family transcription antiterminator LicT [Streptococcus mutans]|jgi:putative transcriptional antiterminator|uniref:BglG family transcription antiterminator LicT n=1 Tax=Streptococcus mutans TaxID=1309 RepID=UPI0001B056FF|nr:PRD domain-containing protein [Streptococcus mutans]AMF85491.1 transcription antiterminator BglG [Streptococcus mutans]ARS62347.1 transcription antiterminator BglG [Streptococcus mutans]EMB60769.1 putative transcriptional antiterminator [Streptococcus mutans 15JP3]EMB66252.1 putative transcriptional antiterminator [Streptococcus mutans 3SN1]EMB74898.1 putative transcriptional antiterminator [Streptococcus mutans 2VS1]
MKIEKVFNNNVVQILGINNEEIIVMGKGLGFQKKPGDEVNQDLIEKRFILQNTDTDMVGELSRVYVDLDSEEIDLVLEIIHQGQEKLGQTFDISLYIALADHLHYTIQRTREGLTLQNPLAWEVRKFYPEEFQLGKDTIELVKEKMTLQLADDEAASIALHFINAQKDGGLLEKNRLISKIVSDILEIVRLHFGEVRDEESISYNRFITHVQYFAQRVANGLVQGKNDAFLYEQVKENYPHAFACTEKIKSYVESAYNFAMSRDEQVYLTIHIQRLETSQ